MLEVGLVLGNEPPQKPEHIRLNVRIRVLVYGQTARSVLRENDAHAFAVRQMLCYVARDIDHLLACRRLNRDLLHNLSFITRLGARESARVIC
jgi:hypothetical protein